MEPPRLSVSIAQNFIVRASRLPSRDRRAVP